MKIIWNPKKKKTKEPKQLTADEMMEVVQRMIDEEPYFSFYDTRALQGCINIIKVFKDFMKEYDKCEQAIDYICLASDVHEELEGATYGYRKQKKTKVW